MASKANRQPTIKRDVVVVGIDVAKRRHVAAVRLPDGSIPRPFSFKNDRAGFEKLLARVVENQPYRPLTNFWEVSGWSCHDPILSRNEVSGNPGAVHPGRFRVDGPANRGLSLSRVPHFSTATRRSFGPAFTHGDQADR